MIHEGEDDVRQSGENRIQSSAICRERSMESIVQLRVLAVAEQFVVEAERDDHAGDVDRDEDAKHADVPERVKCHGQAQRYEEWEAVDRIPDGLAEKAGVEPGR